jgi:alpha-D-ribose 1-methylphosphonate 5-triphosphate synthase subunit PhnH
MDRLRTGSADYPDSSATLVYLVDSLAATGGDLTWKGPGIPGSVSPEVKGLARDEWHALQLANSSYPIGLDAFFLDRTGQVMALPRSTRIEGVPA